MKYKAALIGAAACLSLAAAPLSSASAHGYHRGDRDGGLVVGLLVGTVIGAVALATAPVRALEPPPRRVYVAPPAYYYPPPYAYAPAYAYPAPVYVAPPRYIYRR